MEKMPVFVRSCMLRVSALWKSVQVEFHGEYSIERLMQLKAYHENLTPWHAIIVLALTPIPCLLASLALECIPLNDPQLGVNFAVPFYVRGFGLIAVIVYLVLHQARLLIPTLPGSSARMLAISGLSAFCGVVYLYGVSSAVGFPIPLTLLVGTPVTSSVLGIGALLSWGTFLKNNEAERRDLFRYLLVVCIQVLVTYIYPAYAFAFVRISEEWQLVFACLLPVIKRTIKSSIGYLFRHKPDLKSDMVVLNADMYHVLFVSWCMNGARSAYNIAFFVVMDLVESALAIFHVSRMLQELRGIVREINIGRNVSRKNSVHPFQGTNQPLSLVDLAIAIWETEKTVTRTNPGIRRESDIRPCVRPAFDSASVAVRPSSFMDGCTDIGQTNADRCSNQLVPRSQTLQHVMKLQPQERQQCLKLVLKLLHISEFLLLIEFIEVIVPMVYALYLLAIYHLPNRQYFDMFRNITDDRFYNQVTTIGLYSLLEFVSFALLCAFMQSKLGISPFRQLSFILETQWQMAQAKLVLWVVYAVQLRLEHYGTDFTFQFKWLKRSN